MNSSVAEKVSRELPAELAARLQGGRAVVVATTDAEGWPNLAVVSWLLALSATEVRLAIDPRSRTVQNLARDPRCVLQVLTGGTAYAARGRGRLVAERVAGLKFPVGVVHIDIDEVRDNMFFGGRLQHELTYCYTYKEEAAREIDARVFAALRA